MTNQQTPLDPRHEIETWGPELNSGIIMLHHAIGERMGLSATEHKAADILRRFGPMTAGELADQTGLTTGAVTGLVDRLERNGYVRREHDKSDRRRVIIKPLSRGGRYDEVQGLYDPIRDILVEMISRYNDQELRVIGDFATRTAAILRKEARKLRRHSGRRQRGDA